MPSSCKKYLHLNNFVISSAANGMVLAHGFKNLLTNALTHTNTRNPRLGSLFDWPGAILGTITNREMHLGLEHFSTTGVPRVKFLITRELYILPSQFKRSSEPTRGPQHG